MKKHIYSLSAVLLTAVIMISCTTEDPLITPIKNGFYLNNFDAALAAADSAIELEPNNAVAYYYRGATLGKMAARNPDVADRKDTYSEMRSNLLTAREIFAEQEDPAGESEDITPLILETWSKEHNEAINYATDDSLMNSMEDPLQLAIDHLNNAITINPDSTLSYDVIAQVYYMHDEPAKAADAMKSVISIKDTASALDYDRIASYYFQSDQPDEAVSAIEEGLKIYPDSVNLIQKLADGLFQIDRTDDALEIMNQLIENEPNNALYRLVVGTRIYQRVLTLSDQLEANRDSLFEMRQSNAPRADISSLEAENEALMAEMEPLTQQAEAALLKAAELDDTNPSIFNTLGILYQNKAAELFNLRNNSNDIDEADRYNELAREQTREAMKYYEMAVELDPDNTNYWNSLFRIYTLLDMREKAEEAMQKAGM